MPAAQEAAQTAASYSQLRRDAAAEVAADPDSPLAKMYFHYEPFYELLDTANAEVDQLNAQAAPGQHIEDAERSNLVELVVYQRIAISVREQTQARFALGQQPETEVFKWIYAKLIACMVERIKAAGGAAVSSMAIPAAGLSSAAPSAATQGSSSTSAAALTPDADDTALFDIHRTMAAEMARLSGILRNTQAKCE